MRVNFTVNGRRQEADDVWEGESLLYVLRERMGLPGSKNACEQGECGSCTVRLDGVPVCSCLVAAGQAQDRDIVTVEGLAALAACRTEGGDCASGGCGTGLDEARQWRADPARGTDSQTGEGTELSPVQQAFIDSRGAVQCGFCTPGCWSPPTRCWRPTPRPATPTSARPSPATSAAAPATRRSSTPSASPPPARKAR